MTCVSVILPAALAALWGLQPDTCALVCELDPGAAGEVVRGEVARQGYRVHRLADGGLVAVIEQEAEQCERSRL